MGSNPASLYSIATKTHVSYSTHTGQKGGRNMFEEYKDLLDMSDLQSALGIGRSTAYRLIKDGQIRHLRIGKSIKVPKCYLVDFVESSCYIGSVVENSPLQGGIE